MHVNLTSSLFLSSCDKIVYGEERCALLGGGVKQKIVINQGFLSRQTFWYFYWQNISSCFMRETEVTVLRSTEKRVAQTSRLSVKRDAPPRLPPNEGPFLKGPYLWRYGTHLHKTVHSAVENYWVVRKRPIVAKKIFWSVWIGQTTVNRSEVNLSEFV